MSDDKDTLLHVLWFMQLIFQCLCIQFCILLLQYTIEEE